MCYIVIVGRTIIAGNHSLKISYGTIAVNTGTNPTQGRPKSSILHSITVHCEKEVLFPSFALFKAKQKIMISTMVDFNNNKILRLYFMNSSIQAVGMSAECYG